MTAIDRIFFQQTFPTGQYANVKLGVEMALVPGVDDVQEAFKEAKATVDTAFKAMNLIIEPDYSAIPGHPMNETNSIDKRVETIIGDIELCASINDINAVGVQVGLIAYESAANSDPRIKAAYDLKMIQLKQK